MEDDLKHYILFAVDEPCPEVLRPRAPLVRSESPPTKGPGSGAPHFMIPRWDPRRRGN